MSPFFKRHSNNTPWMTLALICTISRIFIAPFLAWTILEQRWIWAGGLFFYGAFSDFLDGFLARRLREETLLGALLDPLADKILLLSCFVAFMQTDSAPLVLPQWFVWLVLCREIAMILGAAFILLVRGYAVPKPTIWGKLTTLLSMLFIVGLLICSQFQCLHHGLLFFLLVVVVFFYLFSFAHYVVIGLRLVRWR